MCGSDGLVLGVGGTSEVVCRKLSGANPGVWILNPGGFLLPVLSGSRKGEVSVEKLFIPSAHDDVAGLAKPIGVGFKDKFLTFRGFSAGLSDCDVIGKESTSVPVWLCNVFRASSGDFIIDLKDNPGSAEDGVSGEELGDDSAISGESKVELVVVGDESVDSEVREETLLLRW